MHAKRSLKVGLALVAAASAIPVIARAAPLGTAFTYQGRLRANGVPMNGTVNVQFTLWDAAGGGNMIGSAITLTSVPVAGGLFTVSLDFGPAAFGGDARWLQVAVNGQPLSPRQLLASTPYALGLRLPLAQTVNTANDAINITNAGTGDAAQFNITNASNVGEAVEARTAGSGDAVQAVNTGTGRAGYFQISNSGNDEPALYATTSGGGRGVEAHGRWGVYGAANDAGGYGGVFAGSGAFGGGQSLLVTGDAHVIGSVGIGTTSHFATKLNVIAQQTDTAIAGFGDNTGVWGAATTGGIGVFGQTPTSSGYGVYSSGRFAATGTKAFMIDHPLDPGNKYLSHYCTEGPDPLLIYRGNATLDSEGQAVVQLPEYFERINRDFHYQLTPVGAFAPIYVAEEIRDNRFTIAGGRPGMKVSWTVTGIRNDPFVSANAAPTEMLKPEQDRGRYLHPELYGKPESMGLRGPPLPATRERRLREAEQ